MRNYEETKSECNIYEAPKCEIIEVQNEAATPDTTALENNTGEALGIN